MARLPIMLANNLTPAEQDDLGMILRSQAARPLFKWLEAEMQNVVQHILSGVKSWDDLLTAKGKYELLKRLENMLKQALTVQSP